MSRMMSVDMYNWDRDPPSPGQPSPMATIVPDEDDSDEDEDTGTYPKPKPATVNADPENGPSTSVQPEVVDQSIHKQLDSNETSHDARKSWKRMLEILRTSRGEPSENKTAKKKPSEKDSSENDHTLKPEPSKHERSAKRRLFKMFRASSRDMAEDELPTEIPGIDVEPSADVQSSADDDGAQSIQSVDDDAELKKQLLDLASRAESLDSLNDLDVPVKKANRLSGVSLSFQPSTHESYIPFMPNVLKVFLENGQTKSFKYDNTTTVKDVIDSLQEKLNISALNHFALVLQNVKGVSHAKLTILPEHETLAEIAARPDSQHFKCLFRVAFVPKDAYDLLQKDNVAFDYFFTQCTNDVVQERFSSELKYDVALILAALHIQQHHCASQANAKLSLKTLERDTGLETFVPSSVLDTMKPKEIRKLLAHYIKVNQGLAPGQKQLTELQAKLHYLKRLMTLKAFGGKCFVATFVEKESEVMVVVGPRRGVAEVTNIKTNTFQTLAKFSEVESLSLLKENDSMSQVALHLHDNAFLPTVTLSMLNDDIEEFLALVEGYYRLFVDPHRVLLSGDNTRNNNSDTDIVPYESVHHVVPRKWSYEGPDPTVDSPTKGDAETKGSTPDPGRKGSRKVDLSVGPPEYSAEKPAGNEHTTEVPAEKPSALAVEGDVSHQVAPLASPDASTLSGSSDSSVQQQSGDADKTEHHGATSKTKDDDAVSADSVTSGSVSTTTNGSVTTVIPADHDGSPPPDGSTMSRSLSAQDARFGVSSFKTFASPKSSPILSRAKIKLTDDDPERPSEEVQGHSPSHGVTLRDGDIGQSESDTDSFSTPSGSPAKGQPDKVVTKDTVTKETERPQSFGLHSPDPIPSTEDGYKELACSFGLHSPDTVPAEAIHPSYNPRLFSDGALYFDPDIIDLTLIPPPKTPDDEPQGLIDFTSPTITIPPPEFNDDTATPQAAALRVSSSPQRAALSPDPEIPTMMDLPSPIRSKIDSLVHNDEDIGNQLAVMESLLSVRKEDNEKESGIFESESDSGNETISSENIEFGGPADTVTAKPVNLDTLDIDAFIASMTVPPPPSLVEEEEASHPALSAPSDLNAPCDPTKDSTLPSITDDSLISHLLSKDFGRSSGLDDEIAKLVIPPPPDSSAAVLTDIPMVPPVSKDTLQVDSSTNNIIPYDSPTALEGTKLVDCLRAEFESLKSDVLVHQRTNSMPEENSVEETDAFVMPQARALWRPTDVSKSAGNSPLHQPSDISSVNTLPRLLRKKKPPPPPPPRRSSMPIGPEEPPPQTNTRPKHIVHQRSLSVPDESSKRSSFSTFGTKQLVGAQPGKKTDPVLEDLVRMSPVTRRKAATIERDTLPQSTFVVGRESMGSRPSDSGSLLEASRSVESINLAAYREYKRSSSTSSSDSGKSGSDSSRFQAFKSKLKSYVAPSIYKKQLIFSRGSPPASAEPHRSEYLTPTSPRRSGSPGGSPRHSPLVRRHPAPQDPVVSPDAPPSPRTFHTFLGGDHSAPTSPLRTAGIRSSFPLLATAAAPAHDSPTHGTLTPDQGSPRRVAPPKVAPVSAPPQAVDELQPIENAVVIPKGRVLTKTQSLESEEASRIGEVKSELRAKFEQISSIKANSGAGGGKTLGEAAQEILSREYSGPATFSDAERDVDLLVVLLDRAVSSPGSEGPAGDLTALKDGLVAHSRTFVTDSKLLVSSATQSRERLVEKVDGSLHTLARIMALTQRLLASTPDRARRASFSARVHEVAAAYKTTVAAAHRAAGRPLSDPHMKALMKQATALAAILSTFMRALKALECR